MPRPSLVSAPPSTPDFRLRFELVHQSDMSNKQEILAHKIGTTLFQAAANGMYMRANGPLRAQRTVLPLGRPITEQPSDLTTVVCMFGSSQHVPHAQEWVFRRSAMARRADPWEFADAYACRVADLLDKTQHWRASDRHVLHDRYTSGMQDISYLELLGRIARQMQRERVPQNETQLAKAICMVGNTVTTVITGRGITPVSFMSVPPGAIFKRNEVV